MNRSLSSHALVACLALSLVQSSMAGSGGQCPTSRLISELKWSPAVVKIKGYTNGDNALRLNIQPLAKRRELGLVVGKNKKVISDITTDDILCRLQQLSLALRYTLQGSKFLRGRS